MAKQLPTTAIYVPQRYREALMPADLLFECKENYKGNFMYRKLIPNEKSRYHHENGTSLCVKPTGKWWHEDDFATKWIAPKNARLWIVRHYDGIIRELEALYIPGEGWKEGSELSKFIKTIKEAQTSSGAVLDTEIKLIA